MPASEREIESAIEKLKSSPGTFQNLVERYARFNYPDRFKHIVPLGRNPNNVAVKGWPDVYSLADDFRLSVAEVTHSRAWAKHLEMDIQQAEALGKGRFSSFLFVAWDSEPKPLTHHQKPNLRYEKLAHFRGRLVALEIPPDSISFVFKKQLINTLGQPRFAAVLKEILGLPCHPFPFRLIREAQLFGPPNRPEAFAPAEKEYLEGLVHRATLVDEIEMRLEEQGWAWVRGRGAVGKTVLATQIALDYEGRSYPAYYLNLAETEIEVAKALDALTTHADEKVLFVVDNVHLNEGFARDVFNQWQQVSLGSHLVMLGRDVTVTDPRGTANPLEDLQAEAQTLMVSSSDLAGVFHRLARRFLATSGVCPTVPAAELQRWQALFGGDLIAFSAAIALRIRQLTEGDWQLRAQDAANYVREIYLENASDAQRLNLLRIAVLAQLEIDLPVEAIDKVAVKAFLKVGLVHRVKRGRDGEYEYYHLIHPGLGDLLLAAADYSLEELKRFVTGQLCFVARQNPFAGILIAARLESSNRSQEAILILQSIVQSNGGGIIRLLTSGLQHLNRNCELIIRRGVLSKAEIDQELVKDALVLSDAALKTPLGDLVTFLRYAEQKLPQVFIALQRALSEPENLATLSQTALSTPLHFLVTFLDYAGRKLPETSKFLNSKLAESQSISVIASNSTREGFGNLLEFMRTAPIASEVIGAVDRDEWDRFRLADRSVQPDFFPGLAKELQRLGRPELAEAPARALISAAELQHWHVSVIGLPQLGQVMRLGHAVGTESVLRFLERVATPAWLERQYEAASAGALAAFLFGLWVSYDKSVWDHFSLKALTSRLAAETRNLNGLKPELLSGALQFLGSSALIGVTADEMSVEWPDVQQVHEAISFTTPPARMTTIGYIQVQLWLGLLEMARLRSDPLMVQATSGEQILQLWKDSKGYNDKQRTLNASMVDWLEECKLSNWVLSPGREVWTTLRGTV